MDYNQATLHAATGDIILLPGWHGYFYWDYNTNQFNFRNGDYHLDQKQLEAMNILDRKDWYYII